MTQTKSQRAASKRHYHKHATQRKAAVSTWRANNREHYNAYMRELRKKKKLAKKQTQSYRQGQT